MPDPANLRARRENPAFHPSSGQKILSSDKRVFALLRGEVDGNQRVLCLHNVANDAIRLVLRLAGIVPKTHWIDLLSAQRHRTGEDGMLIVEMAPYQIIWARQDLEISDSKGSGSNQART